MAETAVETNLQQLDILKARQALLRKIEVTEEEKKKFQEKKIKAELEEERLEKRLDDMYDAAEDGTRYDRDARTPKQVMIAPDVLRKVFEARIDAFANYYFTPRLNESYEGIIKTTNSKLHWWLYDRLHEVADAKRGTKTAVAAPRGSAKSSVTSIIFVLWCILFKKKQHIIIISDTDSLAQRFLQTIKHELESNSRILRDFPDACGRTRDWRVSDIVTSNDIKVDTCGMGGAIRGALYKSKRPDLVVMDDIENDEHVHTIEQRKKAEDFLNKKILKLGDKSTDYFFIGTILHYDSLLSKTLVNPSWYTKKFKAVIRWSDSDLWEDWERIYMDLTNSNRGVEAREFFYAHEEEMLEGTEVLWPENEPYIDLMEMKLGDGASSFNSEKQNEPIDPDEALFMEEDIHYFDERELKGKMLTIVGAVDPSMGKTEKSNFSAIVTLAKDRNEIIYVLDADIKRRTPDIIIEDIIKYHKQRQYKMFAVETVVFQEFFKDQLLKECRQKNIFLPCKGVKPRKDKALRIQSLQPIVKTGQLRFKRNQQMLINQLIHFPLDFDDGPDCLALAVTLVKKSFRVLTW